MVVIQTCVKFCLRFYFYISRQRLESKFTRKLFLLYRLNYLYGGLSHTRSYHVVNILLHWLCCILLGELASRLFCSTSVERTSRSTRSESLGSFSFGANPVGRRNDQQYFSTALGLRVAVILIFGGQPVHTEAVRIYT